MTVNPVDMQVILPQTGQVNKLSRGLQFQQQMEQQILGQAVQEELRNQEQRVKKTGQNEHIRLENEQREEKGGGKGGNAPQGKRPRPDSKAKVQGEPAPSGDGQGVGSLLDIKI